MRMSFHLLVSYTTAPEIQRGRLSMLWLVIGESAALGRSALSGMLSGCLGE